VSANHASAEAGTTVGLTATPDNAYRLKPGSLTVTTTGGGTVTVTGANSSFSFAMPTENVTVSAEFEALYSVNLDNSLSHGTVIRNPATAAAGTIVKLTAAVEAEGHRFKAGSLTVTQEGGGGVTVDPDPNFNISFTFIMPAANVTVSAEFEAIEYTIITPSMSHGAVSSDAAKAVMGANVTLTAMPHEGYALKPGSLTVTRVSGGDTVAVTGSGPWSFVMPAANVTVSAGFEPLVYAVVVNSMTNGTVSANPESAVMGAAVALTVTPHSGYFLQPGSLTVTRTDGNGTVAATGSGPYAFVMPASGVTVSAGFVPLTSGAITLTLDDQGQGAFSQTFFTINKGGSPNGATRQITLTGTWDAGHTPQWSIDNGLQTSAGNSITIDAATLNTGGHSVTLIVYKNGVPWSKTLDFAVAN
jgi:hypothetical protein